MFSLLILSIVSMRKKNHAPFAVQFYYRFRINKGIIVLKQIEYIVSASLSC